MGDLSRNFSRHEFTCKCCGNAWPQDKLVDALQDLRALALLPIGITDKGGCRCRGANRRAGGARNSRHVIGDGSDIYIGGLSVLDMYKAAVRVPAFKRGGIGLYSQEGFVHVDARGYKARWGRLWKIDENGDRYDPEYVGLKTVLEWIRDQKED